MGHTWDIPGRNIGETQDCLTLKLLYSLISRLYTTKDRSIRLSGMELFEVKILHRRKRLGIKEISAPSFETAEAYITQLLKEYLDLESFSEKIIYIHRSPFERKFKLQVSESIFSISLVKFILH